MSNLRKEYEIVKERRDRAIENLFKEAVINVIVEQQQQAPIAVEQPPQPTPAAPQPQQTPQENPEASTPEQFDNVQRQYTVDDMISELNTIRSGRSFTDPEIYGRLVTFFKNLDEASKASLDQLLTDIAELVTSVEDAYQKNIKSKMTGNETGQATPPQQPIDAPQAKAPMPGAQNIQT